MTLKQSFLLTIFAMVALSPTLAQTTVRDDIWKELKIEEVNITRARNYCQRLYGYYRCLDDGKMYYDNREFKLYNVYEGIFELDIRYSKDSDDGITVIASRDLVHPEKPGDFMSFYELTPYTFLEKARKLPKHYQIETSGDTTRVYSRLGLAGTAVKDTAHQELRMEYDALAPDTALNLNLILFRVHLSNVKAKAVYKYDDTSENYMPQGNLKRISFNGKVDMTLLGSEMEFDDFTEFYIDSVAYFTREEYNADKKAAREKPYNKADIDRLKAKFNVKPLSPSVMQRIEEQREWDEEFELWKNTHKKNKQK